MGSKGMKWDRTRRNPRGYEDASPHREEVPLRGGSHVKPGKVKRWADMTPEERAAVAASVAKPGAEPRPWTVETTPQGLMLRAPASCGHKGTSGPFRSEADAEAAAPGLMKQPCWSCALGFSAPEGR